MSLPVGRRLTDRSYIRRLYKNLYDVIGYRQWFVAMPVRIAVFTPLADLLTNGIRDNVPQAEVWCGSDSRRYPKNRYRKFGLRQLHSVVKYADQHFNEPRLFKPYCGLKAAFGTTSHDPAGDVYASVSRATWPIRGRAMFFGHYVRELLDR